MKHINPILKGVVAATPRQNLQGFTLIEMMVVLLLVSILAAIAIPSYREYVLRNAQTEAQAIMKNQEIKLKQWRAKYLNYHNYCMTPDPNKPNKCLCPDSKPPGACLSDTKLIPEGSDSSNYRYKITLVDGSDTTKPPSNATVKGQNWVMLAEPNPSGLLKRANTYLMKSDGKRCYVAHTGSLAVSSSCTGSGVVSW